MKKSQVGLLAVLGLGGCTQIQAVDALIVQGKEAVRQLSKDDLMTAIAMAEAAGDVNGANCFQFLLAVVPPRGAEQVIASGIESARIGAMAITGPCAGILSPVIAIAHP